MTKIILSWLEGRGCTNNALMSTPAVIYLLCFWIHGHFTQHASNGPLCEKIFCTPRMPDLCLSSICHFIFVSVLGMPSVKTYLNRNQCKSYLSKNWMNLLSGPSTFFPLYPQLFRLSFQNTAENAAGIASLLLRSLTPS